ncbi:MAG: hypothetical protein WC069_01710 [Candidatus Shapirobacteria bacterium]
METTTGKFTHISPDKLAVTPADTTISLIMCCKICPVHNCTKFLREYGMAILGTNSQPMAECFISRIQVREMMVY